MWISEIGDLNANSSYHAASGRPGEIHRLFTPTVLGMKVLRRKDYPDGKFTLAFVGYQDEAEGAVLELTYNWDTSKI